MNRKGIDISTFQGTIDWNRVKNDGIEFAMIRSSYGNDKKQVDAQFHNNVSGAQKIDIPFGCYHYSYATTVEEAKKEAAAFLSVIKNYQYEYPLAFDIEDASQQKLGRALLTDITNTFCSEVKKAGYYAIVYCNLNWAKNLLDMSKLKDYDLWLAQYNNMVTYTGQYSMWQYSSTGKVDGIKGNVDLNMAYKDYPSIITSAGLNGFTASAGSLMLDTKSYTMAPSDIYDIGVTLKGATESDLKVFSSRENIATVERLENGNYRVKGIANGEAYIMFEIYRADKKLNHASVKITIQEGENPHGEKNYKASIF